MKIGIANDHAGVEMKNQIKKHIEEVYGYEVVNFGTDTDESCDYPVYGEKCARAVVNSAVQKGILICGTGIGIGISANKIDGIRCGICSEAKSAALSREHNDANMIAFGARIIDIKTAIEIVDAFLTTEFAGGTRHNRRIAEIADIETRH